MASFLPFRRQWFLSGARVSLERGWKLPQTELSFSASLSSPFSSISLFLFLSRCPVSTRFLPAALARSLRVFPFFRARPVRPALRCPVSFFCVRRACPVVSAACSPRYLPRCLRGARLESASFRSTLSHLSDLCLCLPNPGLLDLGISRSSSC